MNRPEVILVVDDEPSILQLVAISLRIAGWEVHTAPSGSMAIEVARRLRGKLDLVLSDVVMPHMNGYQLIATLRGACPQIGWVLMSGHFPQLCTEEHALAKPFTHAELVSAVEQALSERPRA